MLAVWQARYVETILHNYGSATELHYIKTEGDRVLDTPLPLMGGKGVFTKALDDALLAGEIDMAVHSLKDIPTRLPDGLMIGAVSEREDPSDVLVTRVSHRSGAFDSGISHPNDASDIRTRHRSGARDAGDSHPPRFCNDPDYKAVIASSSNRRIGQWLARYPAHRTVDIRGNVQTRLKKLSESTWDGVIFAAAGLKRLGLQDRIGMVLDWMVPAPAQGAMAVMIRMDDPDILRAVRHVHHQGTHLCTSIERDLLHALQGGCSAPVGALAVIENGRVRLRVSTVYPDGTDSICFELADDIGKALDLGKRAADEALSRGADALIRDLGMKGRDSGKVGSVKVGSGNPGSGNAGSGKSGSILAPMRKVIATRISTSEEKKLAEEHGIRLIDYPAWNYSWIMPPAGHVGEILSRPLPDAWVFTSWRGVEGWRKVLDAAAMQPEAIPEVYAIGKKTSESINCHFPGMDVRMPEPGNGAALGKMMARDGIRSAVHFCGVNRREELQAVCSEFGLALKPLEVYGRRRVDNPKPLDADFAAILFYSPDGVEGFCALYGVPDGDWQAVAIGGTTAVAVRKITGREPETAKEATFQKMLDLVSVR